MDAAEARPEESAHVIAPKTDTANKSDVGFFIRKSLVLEHEFAVIRPWWRSLPGQWAFSAKGERLSAASSAIGRQDLRVRRAQVHAADCQPTRRAANIARAITKHFATPWAIKKAVTAEACH
jgi:hypothetical protein